jgi:hypothetical protein
VSSADLHVAEITFECRFDPHSLPPFIFGECVAQQMGSSQSSRAADIIGDDDDVALLLEVARANPPGSYSRDVAMESAGKVGGDDAVPLLAAELKD